MDESNDAAELYAAKAAKIAAAHREVLAGHTRQVENYLAVAALLVEAKATIAHGQWTAFVEDYLPFGIRTAQMYLEIGEAFGAFGSNPQDLARLPAHFTLLHALAKRPEPPPADEAAPPPFWGRVRAKTKPKALLQAERTIHSLTKEIAQEREARRALTLDALFMRSSVAFTLCKKEYWLDDPQAQEDITLWPRAQEEITAWIRMHIDECHADDRGAVALRYCIEPYLPPVSPILTDNQKKAVAQKLGGLFASGPKMLTAGVSPRSDDTER